MEEKIFELLTKMYSDLSGKIGNIEGKLGTVESRMGNIEGKLGTVESRMDNFEGKLGTVESRMGTIEGKIDSMQGEITELKKAVLRIETDHGNKLDALFDGYRQHSDRLDRIEAQVSKQEEFIIKRVK